MSKDKDAAEKRLEDYNDVFADLYNVLLFNAKRVILESDLTDARTSGQYKYEGELHAAERDTAKHWEKHDVILAVLCIENQSHSDNAMPLRVIGYDGVWYLGQAIQREEDQRSKLPVQPFHPVVTLVLNFSNHRWIKNKSLLECLEIPDELKPYVQDYKINVVDVAFLPEEVIAKFESDFGIIADYMVKRRTNPDYVPEPRTIRHVDAFFKLLEAMSGERGLVEELQRQHIEGKEPTTMKDFFEERDRIAMAKGKAEGEAKGEANGKAKAVRTVMRKMRYSEDEAMDFLELAGEEREACRNALRELKIA